MALHRTEWKYLCCEGQLELVRSRLEGLLPFDPHANTAGSYPVHSLYFDDYRDSCAAGNESGDGVRNKYRIRYYGNNTKDLHFERKTKRYGSGEKTGCSLSDEAYRDLLTGNFSSLFWKTEDPLLKKFCTFSMARYFTPKVIIDYERTAFVEPDTHIRITLDQNITAAVEYQKFLDGSYLQIPVTKEHQHILEVKFDEILPGWLKRMMDSLHLQQTTFSKYYLGRKQLEAYYL